MIPSVQIQPTSLSNQTKKKIAILITLQLIIICLFSAFFPMTTILYKKQEYIEHKYLYTNLTQLLSSSFIKSTFFHYLSYFFLYSLTSKTAIAIYIQIIYFTLNPIIALKFSFVTYTLLYFIVIIQCIFQSKRPFWRATFGYEDLFFCETNFGNPSDSFFLFSFFFLYLITQYIINSKHKPYFLFKRLSCFFLYIGITIIIGILFILNQINYLFQIVLSITIASLSICLLIEFDEYIYYFINERFKTIKNSREIKMTIFFFILGITFAAILAFCFLSNDNQLYVIEDNLEYFTNCTRSLVDFFGVKQTILNITPIFGIIGAFWGHGYTLEVDCGIWWKGKGIKSFIKVISIILFNILYDYLTNFISHSTFQLVFLINCLKHFANYYIVMALFPLFFEKIGFNIKKYIKIDSDENYTRLDQSFYDEVNQIKEVSEEKNESFFSSKNEENIPIYSNDNTNSLIE